MLEFSSLKDYNCNRKVNIARELAGFVPHRLRGWYAHRPMT